ncbi:MAG TPA: flagellar biosynthesis protein FlhA [Chthonomonadales bacterium]|nr:flagellar biosynthesis protein FlhA [Chthonomonadales bacterium]
MAVHSPSASKGRSLARFSDVAMAIGLVAIVAMLIVPIPHWLLDGLIAFNLAMSVVIVLITIYTTEPLQFSVFPSLLLMATLFRLSLNIAATRLILSTAEAGQIIQAFGTVVLGGNFVVGFIAFLILVVVQFVVITNGASRVAEVAARFTLDAMPGKQMSIDADLNAGHLTEEEARERRRQIEHEADFYGAMDGASKFVRGDATAAILIMIINLVGGFAIGMINGQGDALTVLRTYSILTVGEGMVSQIPALMISTATGFLVTRAGSTTNIGTDFAGQLLSHSRPVLLSGALLLALFFVPGFPKLPLMVVGALVVGVALVLMKNERTEAVVRSVAEQKEQKAAAKPAEDPLRLLSVDALLLELGSNLVPLALPEEGGDLPDRVAAARRQIALDLGIVLPMVRIKDNLALRANQYVIKMRDQVIGRHELMPNHVLAIDPGSVITPMEGVRTVDPAFGSPAIWVPRSSRERAEMCGYVVAHPAAVLITHLTETIRSHAHELLTRQEVQSLIEHLREQNKVVVEELIPSLMSLGEVQKVLQNLLRERVSIRDLGTVLEALADWAPRTKDSDQLTEYARAALSRQITRQYVDESGALDVLTLEPTLERSLRDAVQMTPTGAMLAVDPNTATALLADLTREVERTVNEGRSAVLLCSSQVRLALKRLTERNLPGLSIMAYNEVSTGTDVRVTGTVGATGARTAELAA